MSESESLKETLEALRNADDAESLLGRDRLAEVQNHLVDLLAYVEGKVGYTLFCGERNKCRTRTPLSTVSGIGQVPRHSGKTQHKGSLKSKNGA